MNQIIRYQKTKKATIISLLINILLGFAKVVFGVIGSSQALVADGIHSFSDLMTDILLIIAAKTASHPPDQEHPYGHGRVETISTFIFAIILIFIGLLIIYNAIHEFITHSFRTPAVFVLVVAFISIVTKEGVYHYTKHVAKKLNSKLLQANAWHNRSDALSSIVVFIGVGGELLGFHYLDNIAAVIVALMIVAMGVQIAWNAFSELIDTGIEPKQLAAITEELSAQPGVISIHQLRSRSIAGAYFLDVHLLVNPHISVSEGHYIAHKTAKKLIKKFPQLADVTTHIDVEPDELEEQTLKLPDRPSIELLLQQHCKDFPLFDSIQQIRLHYLNGTITIEIIFKVNSLDLINAATICKLYKESLINQKFINDIWLYFANA